MTASNVMAVKVDTYKRSNVSPMLLQAASADGSGAVIASFSAFTRLEAVGVLHTHDRDYSK